MKKTRLFLCILSLIPSVLIAGVIPDNPTFQSARAKLVKNHIVGQGIADPQVLAAMRSVPRHCFIPQTTCFKSLCRHRLAHRRRPDHIAALYSGAYDGKFKTHR